MVIIPFQNEFDSVNCNFHHSINFLRNYVERYGEYYSLNNQVASLVCRRLIQNTIDLFGWILDSFGWILNSFEWILNSFGWILNVGLPDKFNILTLSSRSYSSSANIFCNHSKVSHNLTFTSNIEFSNLLWYRLMEQEKFPNISAYLLWQMALHFLRSFVSSFIFGNIYLVQWIFFYAKWSALCTEHWKCIFSGEFIHLKLESQLWLCEWHPS